MKEPKLVFKCPLGTCGRTLSTGIIISHAPWCTGPEDTHAKEMVFQPELSTAEPAYDWHKAHKKLTSQSS